MREALILASVTPDEEPVQSTHYCVQALTCGDDFDYWRGLNEYWDGGATIVNVEHDMEFSDGLVEGLLACPEPLCAYAYKVWPSAWRRFVYAQSNVGRWIEQGDERADFSSIGFCKITSEARTGPLKRFPWKFVEQSVNQAVAGPWHIHWPEIKHYHDYETEEMTPWQLLVKKLA